MRTFSSPSKLLRTPAIRQGAVVLVDQGALTLATFITGVLVARGNSKEEYGLYVLGWSLLLTVQSFQRALIDLPFTIYAPRLDAGSQKTYQGSTLIHTLGLCAISVLAMLGAYTWGVREMAANKNTLFSILPSLTIAVAPLILRQYIRNSLLALLKVWASVGVSIVATLSLLPIVTGLYFAGYLSIRTAYQIFAIVYAAATMAMIWKHRGRYLFNAKKLMPDFLRGWPIARWALIDVFAYMGAAQAYPWLLLLLMDYQAVAIYGVCLAMASVLAPFLRGSSAYISPRMAHGHKGNNPDSLIRLLRLSILFLSGPFVLWLIIGVAFREHILSFVYGDSYRDFGLLFVLLLIGVTITSISAPLTNALQTLERADVNTGSLLVGALITMTSGWFLISSFGLIGAGVASVGSAAATTMWRWFFLRRVLYTLRAV